MSDHDHREDYAHDAYLERIADDAVGYCKHCGGRVFTKMLRGRRTVAEGQTEPDESWMECPTCGIVEADEVSAEEESE